MEKRVLCLVRLAADTCLTKYGYPYGSGTFNSSTGKYYVCDASEIDCAVGVLSSPTKKNCYYYVFENMFKEPIELGALKDI